jgi:hypothetical protein
LAANHRTTKYFAFLEKRRGAKGEGKNLFSREKKFFPSPLKLISLSADQQVAGETVLFQREAGTE